MPYIFAIKHCRCYTHSYREDYMNIFITSDTHGDLSRAIEMFDAVTSSTELAGIPHVDHFDCIIHCGDYKKDAFALSKALGLEVYCAYGNCDDVWSPDFDILDTDAGSIVVTHGHIEDVNNTHEHLYELACDQGCNAICYGHTHIPVYTEENGYLVINPGSPSKPLDGTEGSCAILTADENGYSGQLIYYADVLKALDDDAAPADADETQSGKADPESVESPDTGKKNKKKKSVGGFLRKIFNYSDGQ